MQCNVICLPTRSLPSCPIQGILLVRNAIITRVQFFVRLGSGLTALCFYSIACVSRQADKRHRHYVLPTTVYRYELLIFLILERKNASKREEAFPRGG